MLKEVLRYIVKKQLRGERVISRKLIAVLLVIGLSIGLLTFTAVGIGAYYFGKGVIQVAESSYNFASPKLQDYKLNENCSTFVKQINPIELLTLQNWNSLAGQLIQSCSKPIQKIDTSSQQKVGASNFGTKPKCKA